MKSIAAIAVIGLLLLVGSASASEVTNVEIEYQDGATVARIDVKGPIRFTHETEVPKDGRPNRMIVDILSATHELGAKEFSNLPKCLIAGVRSSQFSVTPEQIVRVVFDLTASPLYRVESKEGAVIIIFEDKSTRGFKTWSANKVIASTKSPVGKTLAAKPATSAKMPTSKAKSSSAASQNRAIESDRLASLEGGAKAKPTKAAKKTKAAPKPIETTDRRFSAKTYSDMPPVVQAPEPVVKKSAPVAKAPEPVVKKSAPVAKAPKPVVKKSAPVAKAPKPVVKKSDTAVAPAMPVAKKTTKLAQAPKPKAKSPVKVASKPNTGEGQKALAQKVAGKPETVGGKSATTKTRATARFRRKAPSAKIRGTMVAEFPKRLVIKYKAGGRRDPFGSLIDNDRTYDNPIETRIPNVEGLKLVGILNSDGETNRALFEDKAGFSYILKGGDKVRNGYVLRVDEDQVYFQIFEYGWSRTVALNME